MKLFKDIFKIRAGKAPLKKLVLDGINFAVYFGNYAAVRTASPGILSDFSVGIVFGVFGFPAAADNAENVFEIAVAGVVLAGLFVGELRDERPTVQAGGVRR